MRRREEYVGHDLGEAGGAPGIRKEKVVHPDEAPSEERRTVRWKSIAGAVEEQDEMQRQRGGRSGGEVSNIAEERNFQKKVINLGCPSTLLCSTFLDFSRFFLVQKN